MAMRIRAIKSWTSSSSILPFSHLQRRLLLTPAACLSSATDKKQQKGSSKSSRKAGELAALAKKRDKEKRRTRSEKNFPLEDSSNSEPEDHVPVLLGEVIDAFSTKSIRSFVDCTLGAAGHSCALIKSHPEMERFIGIDVDPLAHERARVRLDSVSSSSQCNPSLNIHTSLKNFKHIKSIIGNIDGNLQQSGVDGILMDLGMSSMQIDISGRGFSMSADAPLDMRMDPEATLRAKDILNTWPENELGRVLRDYGEEISWRVLQKKIVEERLYGGLHYTTELVDLIQSTAPRQSGGRHGWIKTAIRVFQALRIAVNDELNTLENSLRDCFECLGPGGRLAVISFHSLEDRIVKRAFLSFINGAKEDDFENRKVRKNDANEGWMKQSLQGKHGTILTRRPVTPSTFEEKVNRRSRSAKLRVIEKQSS